MSMRYALKVFYDGRNFYGSQVQPNKRTVEGELLKALIAMGTRPERFQAAGRTDRGVSALGNVYSVSTEIPLRARALNSRLPHDIRVLATERVHEDFKPRKEALERVYKYFLSAEGLDKDAMRRSAKLMEGERSFHNFCKVSDRSTVRRLNRLEIEDKGAFLVLTFSGDSFLWQMARRLANALRMVGTGELSTEQLQRYFKPDFQGAIPPAPAENLVLWDVRYGFDFEADEYSRRRFIESLDAWKNELLRDHALVDAVLEKLAGVGKR